MGQADGEMTLAELLSRVGAPGSLSPLFTVFGERGKEARSVIAMKARASTKQDSFVVWGNGEQARNWTYVRDVVEGTIPHGRADDGTA
jgi:nucleoside-diphosphate-sugar epimerase